VAGTVSGVSKALALLRNEQPFIASGEKSQFKNAKGFVIANFTIVLDGPERTQIFAAGTHYKFTNAFFKVLPTLGILQCKSFVIVIVTVNDHVGVSVVNLAYPDGTKENFACYERTWGRSKTRTRPAPGNHEFHSRGATPYFDYFGTAAGDPGNGYYSYNLAAWHVVVLGRIRSALCHTGGN
jgi:hypothetical protein